MSKKRKKELLDYCLLKRIPIVEDDAHGSIVFNKRIDNSPLKKLDSQQQVIYLGSLSKFAGQHLRIGWMIGPSAIVKELAEIRQQIDSGLSILPQAIAHQFLENDIKDHEMRMIDILSKRAKKVEDLLKEAFKDQLTFTPARGGFHLYASFPDKSRAEVDKRLDQLLAKRIIVMEGQQFGDQKRGIRLSFGHYVQ